MNKHRWEVCFEKLVSYRITIRGEFVGWIHKADKRGWYWCHYTQTGTCPHENTTFFRNESEAMRHVRGLYPDPRTYRV
jgi:hypothetical protein